MDEIIKAAILFWLPVALIPIGIWISQNKSFFSNKKIGLLLSISGLMLALLSPWTVPSSPSSAVGHLLGFIIGPSILICTGLYQIAFSGNVPVGRLSIKERYIGILFFVAGMIWFSLMHWWELTPVLSTGKVNRYWLIFFPTFLLALLSFTFSSGFAMLIFGDDRSAESKYIFIISAMVFIFLLLAMNKDSTNITAAEFREYIWLSVADLLGIIIGTLLAITSFAIVVYSYEKNLPKPKSIEPPTAEELIKVSKVIENNLGVDE